MAHFVLIYELASNYIERRARFRNQHLQYAWAAVERGELLLGGALANPTDTAILLFLGEGPEIAISFAEDDPYVREGLVRNWSVRAWTTVVGAAAHQPVHPQS